MAFSDAASVQNGTFLTSASDVEPLIPLFAPYCGGVSRQISLQEAMVVLIRGSWSGERRLEGGRSLGFHLHWSGELAPLELLSCALRFPAHPAVTYDFQLPAYQLVQWLMLRRQRELPEAFWRWLLLGDPLEGAQLERAQQEAARAAGAQVAGAWPAAQTG
ncbi:type IV pilus biogenesis protein EbsA [Cyanobium sp. NIES-981]|uniref:type IV pilus biogenesis protein EbsA n=1 Tax=Cyanobium sp. NIES-981 TaxID=1851505 RepID=UPI0007DCC010|nr:type IV pilus biogenesis protein EbsA [Cyanobium sp. NIES-981]SBO41736.1 conserved protein of unknown function [Cyanobium sp. NIES-981]